MEPLRFAQSTDKFMKMPNGKYMPVGPHNQQSGGNIIQSSIYDLP